MERKRSPQTTFRRHGLAAGSPSSFVCLFVSFWPEVK